MIPLSTTSVRFVPSLFEAAQTDAPVFYLRPGSVIERDMLEAELAGDYRAGSVFRSDIARAFDEGIMTLMANDPGRDTVLAIAAANRALEEENAEAEKAKGRELTLDERQMLPIGERQILAGVRETLSEHWPEYRELVARTNRRRQMLPIVAFRRFCTGWDNLAEARPFAVGPDKLITLAVAGSIPALLMKMAGLEAYRMLYASDQAKN